MNPTLHVAFIAHESGDITGPRAMIFGSFLLSVAKFLPDATEGDFPQVAEALQAMLHSLLLLSAAANETPQGGARALLLSQVNDVIAQNMGSARLDAGRIANLAGLSRATLYRLFDGAGGVAAHVRRLRLERVRGDLCDPAQRSVPIGALAERSGLHSVAEFNRSFRRTYGITPGEMRAAALGRTCTRIVEPAPPRAHSTNLPLRVQGGEPACGG